MRQPRVLMLGPLGSQTGGMARVTANLRDSKLAQTTKLLVMNNGKTTPQERSLISGITAQLKLLYKVYKAILQHRAQIVHFQSCALFSFWRDMVHMIVARLLGCRVVWHLHDGTFLKFISEGNFVKRAMIRWALGVAEAVIVLSEGSRRQLSPYAPKVKWQVVANGVPIPPEPSKHENQEIRFVFMGNLTRRKGAYDLIKAAEKVQQRGLDFIVQLAGGEVEPGQREEIEKYISESSCAEQIELLGIITGDKKDEVLAASDCMVLPSYAEGLPMVLLEGMAYGMGVIATRIGSIPEAVKEEVEGFLIEPGDVEGLAENMYRLAEDKNLRQNMGRAAREAAEQKFSLDIMADRIREIYNEVLSID